MKDIKNVNIPKEEVLSLIENEEINEPEEDINVPAEEINKVEETEIENKTTPTEEIIPSTLKKIKKVPIILRKRIAPPKPKKTVNKLNKIDKENIIESSTQFKNEDYDHKFKILILKCVIDNDNKLQKYKSLLPINIEKPATS